VLYLDIGSGRRNNHVNQLYDPHMPDYDQNSINGTDQHKRLARSRQAIATDCKYL
jgi:hypothetical protein